MRKMVAATIGSDSLELEWEPDEEVSTTCCSKEELQVQSFLKDKGLQVEKKGISCKLREVPEVCELEKKND